MQKVSHVISLHVCLHICKHIYYSAGINSALSLLPSYIWSQFTLHIKSPALHASLLSTSLFELSHTHACPNPIYSLLLCTSKEPITHYLRPCSCSLPGGKEIICLDKEHIICLSPTEFLHLDIVGRSHSEAALAVLHKLVIHPITPARMQIHTHWALPTLWHAYIQSTLFCHMQHPMLTHAHNTYAHPPGVCVHSHTLPTSNWAECPTPKLRASLSLQKVHM